MTKIKGFDGLRALSVIFVILTHLGIYATAQNAGWLSERAAPIISGTTGVQIFFVLSGFLITSLLIKEHEATGSVSLKGFYIRRALRILPLYFLCVLLTWFVDVYIWPVASTPSLIFAATFNTSFIPREWYSSILGHTWSLSVEEHFYLLWPAALLFLYKFNFNRALVHILLGTAISLCLLAVVMRIEEVNAAYFVARWSIFAGSWIALGCAAAIVVNGSAYARANALLASRGALWLAAALFLHSIVLGLLPKPLDETLRVLGAVLLVCWIAHNQKGRIVSALEYGPLAYTGKISYGLYMWQGFFLATGPGRAPGQLWPLNAGMGLILLCIVAPLSYHFFEKRFLALSGAFRHKGAMGAHGEKPARPSEKAPTASIASVNQ
ncbi:acyltransferase [uncultured Erythrobacter sp.]|uniref:acyltransferase family protein n=1 Tax=uncultured Erythrobacter sp. TaxID=263913 RepID=UPI0026210445|nr:acyltransferase [uncultured Erythrobacter sp.]